MKPKHFFYVASLQVTPVLRHRSPFVSAGARVRERAIAFADWLKSSQQTRGVANVEPGLGYVSGNNCAGTDDGAITDLDRENGGVRSDADTVAKPG